MTTHRVHHSAAGEGDELGAPDATVTVKVGARHTAGGFELFEVDASRGPAAPAHREPWSKAFYVLSGRILVQVDDEGYDLTPGASITVPPGALNTFTVLTPSARFLAISPTGGMGEFFADLDRSLSAQLPATEAGAALGAVAERHHVVIGATVR